MSVRASLGLALASCALASCGGPRSAPARLVSVRVTAPAEGALDLARVRWDVPVARATVSPRELVLSWDEASAPARVTLRHPEACDAAIDLAGARVSAPLEAMLRPWIDVGEPIAQAGWDAPFEVSVRPGCREATAGRIEWSERSGSPLRERRVARNGFLLRARTERFEDARPGPLPWGVVALSPRTRGEHVLVARWHGRGRPDVEREVHVCAAARSGGMPAVAIGTRLFLGGSSAWTIRTKPPASHAAIDTAAAPIAAFEPDVRGRYELTDADGRVLSLRAGAHDETPLDCGRAECHAAASAAASRSLMTNVLARGLEGGLGAAFDSSCAIECHAVGEPGLPDGGFSHVARSLHRALGRAPTADAWNDLPRALRRLGGVGCTACHGPGAIPEASARWAVLRADVCAVCHDAPPRYGHVAAWRTTRMSRADATARVRDDASCRACHTTQGFLADIGARPLPADGGAPADAGAIGVACAACHAVHAASSIGIALVRRVPTPSSLGALAHPDARSTVCLRCHSPEAGPRAPGASAAALVLGRGGVSVATGAPLAVVAPHASLAEPCLACHSGPASGTALERGGGHAFVATPARCTPCHADGPPPEPRDAAGRTIRERALALAAELGLPAPGAEPPHATPVPVDLTTPLGRARYNVLLVLEDPAAWPHAGPSLLPLLSFGDSNHNSQTPDP